MAVDDAGNVLTSTDPAGGAAAWSTADVDGGNEIIRVSCASGPVCMAVDNAGNALISTDPTGGASAWQLHNTLDTTSGDAFTDVSCASVSLCIASSSDALEVVEDPGQVASSWKAVQPASPQPNDEGSGGAYSSISCPSDTFCIATDDYDGITTTDPTGDAGAWSASAISYYDPDTAVRCYSAMLCLGLNDSDTTYQTSTPTADYTQWGVATPGSEATSLSQTAASCPSSQFCIIVGDAGEAWTGEGPDYAPPSSGPSSGSGTPPTSGSGTPPTSGSGTPSPAPSPPTPNTVPPSSAPAPAPTGTALGATGAAGAAAVTRPATPTVARARTSSVTVTPHRPTAHVVLACGSSASPCAGTIALTAVVAGPTRHASPGGRSQTPSRTLVLGRCAYRVRAGRSARISIRLSAETVTLLRRRHGAGLTVTATLTGPGGRTATSRLTLVLRPFT